MRVQENPRLTYARFNQMMSWRYKITDPSVRRKLEDSRERSVWFAEMAATIVKITPGFAEISGIDVSDSKGDDAFCWLVVDNNYSRDNLDYLEGTPVSLRLALGTDIYSYFAFGPERDNRVLAALNGPRLRSFLQRLQECLPLTLEDIDAYDYEKLDLVDRYGFKLPEDPAAFAKLIQR